MNQKLLSIAFIIIGFAIAVIPFTAGEDAYFAKETYYINIKDSIDLKYGPYLNSLVQKDRSDLAFQEKKALREKLKTKGDSLEIDLQEAKSKGKSLLVEKINILKNELRGEIASKELDIDEKYDAQNLDEEEYKTLFEKKRVENSQMDYVVAVANEIVGNSSEKSITQEDISVQRINKQRTGAFLYSGGVIMLCGALLFLVQNSKLKLHDKKTKYLILTGLTLLCFITGKGIYSTFADRIAFDKEFASRDAIVKAKLNNVRALQLSYYESKNKYCNNWDSLKTFAQNDSIEIVKYLVNKDDTAAVNEAKKAGLAIEERSYVSVLKKTFGENSVDISNIEKVPFGKDNFKLNAGIIEKNGRNIHVFEVKTPKYSFVENLSTLPENFDKTSEIILGSMNEPTTEGNW